MRRIIINADDLGVSPIVNTEIEQSLKKGLISSSTILANSDYFDEVVKIVKSFPDKSFGVHLNITEGPSLTNNEVLRKAGIINSEGAFIKSHNFNSRLYDTDVIKAVTEEWTAQVEEVLSHGIKISHIDGHHHCHTWYGYNASLIEVANKFGIKKVRRCYRFPVETAKGWILNAVSCGLKGLVDAKRDRKMNRILLSMRSYQDRQYYEEIVRDNGNVMTDFFCSYEDLIRVGGIKSLPDKCTIELMCHPGHKSYAKEYLDIQNKKLGDYGDRYELITYNQL